MATSPILAFIDSRTNQAQRKAKSAILMKKEKGSTQSTEGRPAEGDDRQRTFMRSSWMVLCVISAKAGMGGCTLI